MHSLHFLCLYKAENYYRRLSRNPKTETRQTHDLNTTDNVCNVHYTLQCVTVAEGNDI